MATQRNAAALAEFAKLNEIGAAIFGQITKYGTNNSGPFVIFSPAGYRERASDKFERFQEVALGLSTDLLAKIQAADVGAILFIVLVATKPTQKSPMKIFNVWAISASEARSILAGEVEVPSEWMTPPAGTVGMGGREAPIF